MVLRIRIIRDEETQEEISRQVLVLNPYILYNTNISEETQLPDETGENPTRNDSKGGGKITKNDAGAFVKLGMWTKGSEYRPVATISQNLSRGRKRTYLINQQKMKRRRNAR